MSLRKVLFWLHLSAGCVAGTIVLLMSVTGVLLVYERQIVAWADREPLRAAPPPGARPLGAEALLTAAGQQRGGLPASAALTLRSDPREPAEIRAGRDQVFYVNIYTGRVTDGGTAGTRAFFQKVTAWHRWLGVEGADRATARAITGACNFAFLFLVVSGAWLWMPRRWSRQFLRPITWFRSGLSGKARDFNWHNVLGFWCLIPLFFVVLTALPMSYPWANSLIYRMAGSEPPPPTGAGTGSSGKGEPSGRRPVSPVNGEPRRRQTPSRTAPAADLTGLDRLWARAAGQVPGWKSISAPVPASLWEPVTFSIDTGDGGQPQKRSALTLDPATGAILRWEKFGDANAGRRLRMWSRFVHTGEYYGVAGQTVAGIASAAAAVLVWTGISLALRRFAAWNARRRKREPMPNETAAADEDDEEPSVVRSG